MTIDSGWNKIIKTAVPTAFRDKLADDVMPSTVFIDGQIKLMCSSSIQLWTVFFKVQFLATIEQAFKTGATTVVLGFDDYSAVPEAKNMTQLKRSRHVPAMVFNETDELPPIMPTDWASAMRNRTFKVKVIKMIIMNIQNHYSQDDSLLKTKKTIIVDFVGPPHIIGYPVELPDLSGKRGECDIKAFAWMCYGPLLIFSTDGDFVAISLVQLERVIAATRSRHHVFLLRMKTKVENVGKHSRDGPVKREYEYVDMLAILNWVNTQMSSLSPNISPAKSFAALVAVTGCDFAMNLPSIGPSKLWAARGDFVNLDLTTPEGLLMALTRVYYKLYHKKIQVISNISSSEHDLDSITQLYAQVAASIKSSTKISQVVQSRTWQWPRMQAHVRNAHWTLQYWTDLQHYPDPVTGAFGFQRQGKHVTFEGDV